MKQDELSKKVAVTGFQRKFTKSHLDPLILFNYLKKIRKVEEKRKEFREEIENFEIRVRLTLIIDIWNAEVLKKIKEYWVIRRNI